MSITGSSTTAIKKLTVIFNCAECTSHKNHTMSVRPSALDTRPSARDVTGPAALNPQPIASNLAAAAFNKKTRESPNILSKSLGGYYFDRFEDKVNPYRKLFNSSRIFYAPASEFSLIRQELACLENQLVRARNVWADERKVIAQRWDAAIAKHHLVQENIPKFNGYYKDGFTKRDRAIQSQLREREQCEQKNREIRRLIKEKRRLEDIKSEQDTRLEKFSIFKTYLAKVKESSQGEYGDLREIIDRYAILAEARNNLLGRTESTRDTVQRRQKALERDILMKSNEVLAYRNFLSELMDYQNALHEQVNQLEDNLLRIKTTAAKRTLIIGQIKMAIRNLYLQVCKHMHRSAKITPEDTLGQLMDIRISVREMYKLAKDIKHMLRNAYLTAEAEARAREKQKKKLADRQKRLDKLGIGGVMDPRKLFGMEERKESMENKAPTGQKVGYVDPIGGPAPPAPAANQQSRMSLPNQTVEKTALEAAQQLGIVSSVALQGNNRMSKDTRRESIKN